jgi:putative two-component system response regulator
VGCITSIADVFDALTSMRPYKQDWPIEDAVALLQREAATSFDPELVKKFVGILPQVLAVCEKYSDAPHAAP